ncbi:unnamed protein product [Spirodela intermedia]|uniref:LOB domain-containing protein n=1 Tax=Spirodela intermedia TaxID=51605 RepID=A0A7I8KMI7_SPIIN|nr:unnamed protein product [Spirodela intermedia]
MTGLGSPCGACKFLRRKCVRGCIFAPYFCHEQGAKHFAAIHKVFGASNVSKLLTHLPAPDRCEAAVTISYEAQARLQDPVYGCVGHIFALQQQVVNLQAQLSSLKAQAAGQGLATCIPPNNQEEKLCNWFPLYQQTAQGILLSEDVKMMQPACSNPAVNPDDTAFYDGSLADSGSMQTSHQCYSHTADQQLFSFGDGFGSPPPMVPFDARMDELQSLAFSGLRRS